MSDLDENISALENVLSADTVAEKRRLKELTRPRMCLTLDLQENSPQDGEPGSGVSVSVLMERLLDSSAESACQVIPLPKPPST